ncbi:TonB-dependent receptor plug domain-containing protein [Chitinophagaceae bacterium 26-R-25]|nr:TonB-dependent receptor plug domain-containing protein [Chitinophagaceae bacterium 26-R-25]
MTPIAYYLLKMLICSGILTGYYYACLQNKLFHQWNRFYLLLTVIFSVTFPLLYIPIFDFNESSNSVGQMVYRVSSSELLLLKGETQTLSFFDLIVYGAYCFAVFVFLLLFVFSLYKIYSLKRKSTFIQQSDINIYQTNASQAPFSFFKNIFWKQSIDLQSTEGQQILKHELVHVHEKHTADKVFMQLVLSVFWINPFFWLIKKELTIIHEFIADKKSVGNNDASVLASLILTTTYSSGRFDITNQFFHSSIKRRITMVTKNKDPRFSYMRRIAALFVLLATLGMVAFRSKNVNEITSVKSTTDTIISPKKLFDSLERRNFDTMNAVYLLDKKPVSAAEIKNLTADKVESVSSWIETRNGKYTTIVDVVLVDPKRLGSVSLDKANPIYYVDDKEVTEKDFKSINPNNIQAVYVWKGEKAVAKFGEKGLRGVIDVRMKTTKPDSKKENILNTPVPDTVAKADAVQLLPPTPDKVPGIRLYAADPNSGQSFRIRSSSGKLNPPVYLVDGKEVTDINSIDPDTIESITVLKDSTAVKRYGAKGINGAIILETKKATKPALVP